jgi:acetolactate synthase-1/2/3 large subunit
VRTSKSTAELAQDAADAVAAAIGPPGQVATLILPADVSWSDGGAPAPPPAPPAPPRAADEVVETVARALRSRERSAILLGGRALREPGLLAAARIAQATGAKLLVETFPARLERGEGLPRVEQLAYFPELASVQLGGLKHLILVEAKPPVSFFAYPGKKSYLVPDGCQVHELAGPAADVQGSLDALVEAVNAAGYTPARQQSSRPERPTGSLSAESAAQAIGAILPEGAIVSDEAVTSGLAMAASTAGAPRHDWLTLTGGAIGQGLPVAVGAAVACPDRPVFALEGEGSSLYTIQSLWTMAREQLDVTTVIFNNRSYAILNIELERVKARAAGPRAKAQLDLSGPKIDFVQLAAGFGVPAVRPSSTDELLGALDRAVAEPGPHLIELVVPSIFSPRQVRAMPYALRALQALPQPVAAALKRRLYP